MIEASRKEIGISSLTHQDLRKLKTDDTFLYYYIPSIRRKFYLCDDGDDGDANKTLMARRSPLLSDFRKSESIIREEMRSLVLSQLNLTEDRDIDTNIAGCWW